MYISNKKDGLSSLWKDNFIILNTLLALFAADWHCLADFNVFVVQTPKSFSSLVSARGVSFNIYSHPTFLEPIWIFLHFLILNWRSHSEDHLHSFSRSDWNWYILRRPLLWVVKTKQILSRVYKAHPFFDFSDLKIPQIWVLIIEYFFFQSTRNRKTSHRLKLNKWGVTISLRSRIGQNPIEKFWFNCLIEIN